MYSRLTILYTQNLRGDLDRLPRIYNVLRSLKGEGRTLLVDLGGSCDPAVWHCEVTEGRSVLIALDGMGFHAANISGVLSDESREKLTEQVSLALLAENTPFVDDSSGITINLSAQQKTTFVDGILNLQTIESAQIGEVILSGDPLSLHSATVHDVPSTTPKDPTIAGVVDFILGEARFFQKRQSDE
ncbi:MAG: hypothetical protein RLP44_32705 [Aggregatilineales bacterium]